ncbi:hypothetical protein Tco_1427264, partial [Tanacetum coccineum]
MPTLALIDVTLTVGEENSTHIVSDSPFILSPKKSLERQLLQSLKQVDLNPSFSELTKEKDPDDPVLIDYDIDGKMYKITYDELQDHLNKKGNFEKALKEGEFSKLVIIKDELGAILPKKANKCIGEMMTSLSNRYERLKKILEYLGLDLTLPLPQQDPSLPRRKRK